MSQHLGKYIAVSFGNIRMQVPNYLMHNRDIVRIGSIELIDFEKVSI